MTPKRILHCRIASCSRHTAPRIRTLDVGPDKPVNQNSTPLSSALDNGHEGAGKLLLGRESVAPNRPGESYRTPPQRTIEEHEVVIEPPLKPELSLDVSSQSPEEAARKVMRYLEDQGLLA